MDNSQSQNQCSPCFPTNPETFTFNSSKLKSIQMNKLKTPYISSPLCLMNQSPSDTSNFQLSYLISPRDPRYSLSFKDNQKASPFIHPKYSSPSLNDLILSISSESGSSSRNLQKSPHQQIDSKDKQFLLPNTKYSGRYQEDYTIIEDPHEDSFQLKQLRNNPVFYLLKKDNSENERKRMIKELFKLSNSGNKIAEEYNISHAIPESKKDTNTNNTTKEDKLQMRKGNEDNTCSTEDNEEEIDEETKLYCFLSIPRIVCNNNKKQLMCFSLCNKGFTHFNQEEYSLTFKDIMSMIVIQKIPVKAFTFCGRKTNQQLIIEFINQKTFLKTKQIIETRTTDDCLQYVKGIKLLLLNKTQYY